MKRTLLLSMLLIASLALPGGVEAQVDSGFGIGAKMLFPTGDLDDAVKSGWGLAGTGELRILHFLAATGEISYYEFPGESSGDLELEDQDFLGFAAGARLYLAALYLGADMGYFTDLEEFSFIPNVGLKFAMFEVAARYKATDANWMELRGTVNF